MVEMIEDTGVTLNAASMAGGFFFVQHRFKGREATPTRFTRDTTVFQIRKNETLYKIIPFWGPRRCLLTKASAWIQQGQAEFRVLV